MIHPRYWLKHASARRAVRNYPLYDVPHKQAERTLNEKRVQDNFTYFMRVRLYRLASFTSWLRTNFRSEVNLDGDGLRKVSRWVDNYGGGLIGDETGHQLIFESYQPRWEGRYAGYNVMIDLAIFFGEYLIKKRPQLSWEIDRGTDIEPASFESSDFMRPCLGGMPRLWKSFPLMTGYGAIANSRDLALIHPHRAPRDVLVRKAQSTLYLSSLPNGTSPIIIGDSSNEPL
jgi:hypothetical protein